MNSWPGLNQPVAGRFHVVAGERFHLSAEAGAAQRLNQGLDGREVEVCAAEHQLIGLFCKGDEIQ